MVGASGFERQASSSRTRYRANSANFALFPAVTNNCANLPVPDDPAARNRTALATLNNASMHRVGTKMVIFCLRRISEHKLVEY